MFFFFAFVLNDGEQALKPLNVALPQNTVVTVRDLGARCACLCGVWAKCIDAVRSTQNTVVTVRDSGAPWSRCVNSVTMSPLKWCQKSQFEMCCAPSTDRCWVQTRLESRINRVTSNPIFFMVDGVKGGWADQQQREEVERISGCGGGRERGGRQGGCRVCGGSTDASMLQQRAGVAWGGGVCVCGGGEVVSFTYDAWSSVRHSNQQATRSVRAGCATLHRGRAARWCSHLELERFQIVRRILSCTARS